MTVACTARIRSCTGSPVQRIVLELPPDYRFRPGQYLLVEHPDGPVPLSIASAPWRLPELHLHYRSTPGLAEAARMDALLTAGARLPVSAAAGDVILEPPLPGPVLLAAGGTGIAQVMSFLDAFTAVPPGAPVTVLWCADRADDFYLAAELERLDAPWLELELIADPDRSPANRGLAWLRARAARWRAPPAAVVLAGGPPFVYAACEALATAGVPTDRMRSDVFAYAPR